eukprot:CAMPEP_0180781022 /NCGR_PEP_ID=MMETSP1038_2-20121128/47382_1 /TAXON_ID=632150 /ORGANISM="Azadinium spinosum, Strain 3D9" /LENGTH=71 /DNA_ID=CAMNT_0022816723 /DNA_START=382 /DNA_END=594 /DNA_ORIENTATION=-
MAADALEFFIDSRRCCLRSASKVFIASAAAPSAWSSIGRRDGCSERNMKLSARLPGMASARWSFLFSTTAL